MAVQDLFQGPPDGLQARLVESRFGEHGRVAGRGEQVVAFPQREPQGLGEPDHDLASRPGTAALDEADMTLRRTGQRSQLQLTDTTDPPPTPYLGAHGGLLDGAHARVVPGTTDIEAFSRPLAMFRCQRRTR